MYLNGHLLGKSCSLGSQYICFLLCIFVILLLVLIALIPGHCLIFIFFAFVSFLSVQVVQSMFSVFIGHKRILIKAISMLSFRQ